MKTSKFTDSTKQLYQGQLKIDLMSPLNSSKLASLNKATVKDKIANKDKNGIKKTTSNIQVIDQSVVDKLRSELNSCKDKILYLEKELYIKERVVAKLQLTLIEYQNKQSSTRTFKLSIDENSCNQSNNTKSQKDIFRPANKYNDQVMKIIKPNSIKVVAKLKEEAPRLSQDEFFNDICFGKSILGPNLGAINSTAINKNKHKVCKKSLTAQSSEAKQLRFPSTDSYKLIKSTDVTTSTQYRPSFAIQSCSSFEPDTPKEDFTAIAEYIATINAEELDELDSLMTNALDLKTQYNNLLYRNTSIVHHNYDQVFQFTYREKKDLKCNESIKTEFN